MWRWPRPTWKDHGDEVGPVVITRKVLALIVAVGIVPAAALGVVIGVAVAVAGDRLRTACGGGLRAAVGEWKGVAE